MGTRKRRKNELTSPVSLSPFLVPLKRKTLDWRHWLKLNRNPNTYLFNHCESWFEVDKSKCHSNIYIINNLLVLCSSSSVDSISNNISLRSHWLSSWTFLIRSLALLARCASIFIHIRFAFKWQRMNDDGDYNEQLIESLNDNFPAICIRLSSLLISGQTIFIFPPSSWGITTK